MTLKRNLAALLTLCAFTGLAGCSSDGGDDESMDRAVSSQVVIALSDSDVDEIAGTLCTFLEEGSPQIPAGDLDAAAEAFAFVMGSSQADADHAVDAVVDARCPGVR